MSHHASASADSKFHRIQQAVKWTVYTLLFVNFVFYFYEDWNRAVHTLGAASTILDRAGEFATSIDELGWFILLFMFELETYILEDEDCKGWVGHAVRGARLVCFAMIAHTVYAFLVTVSDLQPTVPVENVVNLCDMTGADISYVYNLEYTDISEQSCAELSDASQFYWVAEGTVVSDITGLGLERDLAWADLAEVVIWLLVLATIEIAVRLQNRGVTAGTLMSAVNRIKIFLYLSLIGLGVYWACLSHWLYLWDELVWILGFAAIEMNVSEWREELLGEQVAA